MDPNKTFFVDDAPANIQGSRQAGLTAIQFTTAGALRDELVRLGAL